MRLTDEVKDKIVLAVRKDRKTLSGNKHAVVLGITSSQYSEIMKGNYDKQLKDDKWLAIAYKLKVFSEWKTIVTPTYAFIYEQLKNCQNSSFSAIFCDLPNIGKTHTAKEYQRQNANVAYVDCSRAKTKKKLIKTIAQELGIAVKGTYDEMFSTLVKHICSLDYPLVIFDEAGDLKFDAFLEIKALWNATEGCCGWFMMGAEGLQLLINRAMNNQKVGFAEIYSRYGNEFQNITIDKDGKMTQEQFLYQQAYMVARGNAPEDTPQGELKKWAMGGLRRLKMEIEKNSIYG